MSTSPETGAAQAWADHKVAFIGGTYDTRAETGEDYETRTLGEIFAMPPAAADKLVGPAFIPSSYHDYDARSHQVQAAKGAYVALTADIDKGDHTAKTVHAAVHEFVGDHAYTIYSSPHARPGDRRWRVIVPLVAPTSFEAWHDAQTAFFAFFAAKGIETDGALARAGQLVFLPNVPEKHGKTGEPLRKDDGAPLYFQRHATSLKKPGLDLSKGLIADGMAEIARRRAEDEKEREQMRAEAAKRRANRPQSDEATIIESFNAGNSVATMLEICGYEQSPRSPQDWRSPYQQGQTYATRVMDDGTWFSLSQSDVDARVGQQCRQGCFGDAYDLYAHFKHGGDHKAAYRAIGQELRGNVIRPTRFNPPEWMQEPPPYDEAPEWAEGHSERAPDIEEAALAAGIEIEADVSGTDVFALLDLDELEALPPPEWLVKDLVVQDGLTVIFGDPGSGKSFVAIDLSLRVALGMDWHGAETRPTGVLYIAGEGARGLGKRVKGWRREHGLADARAPFLLLPVPVALLDPEQRSKLLRTIDEAVRRAGFQIGLVVIDTVSRSLAGAGENGADEMGAFVTSCDAVRMHTGGAVLGIHHSGKDKEKGMRGSTVLLGACDGVIRVTKSEDLVTLKTEKQKDAEQAAPVHMRMKTVSWQTGADEWQSTLVPFLTTDRPVEREEMRQDQIDKAFEMLTAAWNAGTPLSSSPQVRSQGRYAPSVLSKALQCSEKLVAEYLTSWLENQCLSIEIYDNHSKSKGLRVITSLVPGKGL